MNANDSDAAQFILFISFLFYKNGIKKAALKNILFFAVFSLLIPNLDVIRNMNAILMIFFMLFAVCRMFYLPFSAGSFFVKTSDVGSIISSMDKRRGRRNHGGNEDCPGLRGGFRRNFAG